MAHITSSSLPFPSFPYPPRCGHPRHTNTHTHTHMAHITSSSLPPSLNPGPLHRHPSPSTAAHPPPTPPFPLHPFHTVLRFPGTSVFFLCFFPLFFFFWDIILTYLSGPFGVPLIPELDVFNTSGSRCGEVDVTVVKLSQPLIIIVHHTQLPSARATQFWDASFSNPVQCQLRRCLMATSTLFDGNFDIVLTSTLFFPGLTHFLALCAAGGVRSSLLIDHPYWIMRIGACNPMLLPIHA